MVLVYDSWKSVRLPRNLSFVFVRFVRLAAFCVARRCCCCWLALLLLPACCCCLLPQSVGRAVECFVSARVFVRGFAMEKSWESQIVRRLLARRRSAPTAARADSQASKQAAVFGAKRTSSYGSAEYQSALSACSCSSSSRSGGGGSIGGKCDGGGDRHQTDSDWRAKNTQ